MPSHRLVALGAVGITGLIHTVARRWSMNPDGISYLDIADRYLAHDWAGAINATWSPALSWIFAGVLGVTTPSPAFEFTIVHLTLYSLYLLTFLAFEAFLRAVSPLPRPWYLTVLAYSIFLWATVFLVDLQDVTPDIAVAGLTFAAAALATAVRKDPQRVSRWVALGAVLGAAYLTKAVMLYVGLALIVTTVLAMGRVTGKGLRVAAIGAAYIVIAGPWVTVLSRTKGRFTTGDIGKISLAWFVNDVTPVQHWQGNPRGFGTPVHTTRQLLADPHVYEFGTPIRGTHPPRFDPSYWYEGVRPRMDIPRILRIALTNIGEFAWLVVPLVVAVGALSVKDREMNRVLTHWPLFLPMVVGIGLFTLIYFETRYVAAFVAVLYLTVLAPFLDRASDDGDGAPNASRRNVALVLAMLLLAPVAYQTAVRAFQAAHLTGENPYWTIARGLQARGVRPGSTIAVIGDAHDAPWARLAQYRVVAEIPSPQSDVFWSCDETARAIVLDVLASTGAAAVVAMEPPAWARTSGWTRSANGGPLVAEHFVPRSGAAASVSPSYLDYRHAAVCAPKRR